MKLYSLVLPLSFVVVKYEDFTEELKEVEMNQDWKVGHDAKRDRLVRQVKRFTGFVDEALGQGLKLKRDLQNISQGAEVADRVLHSPPSFGGSTILSPARVPDLVRQNRSINTPQILSSICKDATMLVNAHQTMSAAAEKSGNAIETSILKQGMSAVKSVFESAMKSEIAANTQAQGRGKKSAKAYSCNFVYSLVPLLPYGVPAEEFKVGRMGAYFDALIEVCKEFNLRYGTYITHFYVELFKVQYDITGAQIEKLILRFRDIESPKGCFPFKRTEGRGVDDIKHDALKQYLQGRLESRPLPTENSETYFESQTLSKSSFLGFAMVIFIYNS